MDLTALIASSPSAAVALVILSLFIAGKIHSDSEYRKLEAENEDLKKALAAERQAVNETAQTGTVTNQLIGALTQIAAGNAPRHPPGEGTG